MHWIPFFCIYSLLATQTIHVLFREIFQMIFNWPHYHRSLEDKMELAMIILCICYVFGVFFFPLPVLKHFAAWSVFFAWIEMILLIGRFSTVGKYVQMVFIVSKVLIKYLMVYIPAVLAFSLAFYILLSENNPFINPGNSFMKTMVMLLGELEYEGNFMWTPSDKTIYFPSTQILIMLFVLLGCIAIMNLLVGLAVDELDVMRQKGKEIRLGIAVNEIMRQEDLMVKKPTLLDCCTCLQDFIIKNHSLFYCLTSKFENGDEHLKRNASPTKICVRPIMPRVKEGTAANKKISKTFPVYFYYEKRKRAFCRKGQETGFNLPENIVKETMDWLKKNQDIESEIEIKKDNAVTSDETDACTDRSVLLKIQSDIDQILSTMSRIISNKS